MAERSAHLVHDVLPDVPVRQWVFSLPHRLRYLLAWDHALCRAVALRVVLGFLRRRARREGIADGRSWRPASWPHAPRGAPRVFRRRHAVSMSQPEKPREGSRPTGPRVAPTHPRRVPFSGPS